MNTLFWLSFFFAPPPHHQPTTCSTYGTPMLEIRERSEKTTAVTTKRIYSSGGWTLKSDNATARGCEPRDGPDPLLARLFRQSGGCDGLGGEVVPAEDE